MGTVLVPIEFKAMDQAAAKAFARMEKKLDGVTAAQKKQQAAADKAERSNQRLGKTLETAGKAAIGFGAALGATKLVQWGKAAAHTYMEFGSAVARIGTLIPGQTRLQNELAESAERLSVAYGVAATDAAGATFQAISAGVAADKAGEFMEVAAKNAVAGFNSTEESVRGLTTVMNAYGLGVEEAMGISDAMFTANKLGVTTSRELGASLGTVVSMAAKTGVSYRELMAATVALTKAGVSTSEGMTGLRAILASIIAPSEGAAKVAKDLGIQWDVSLVQSQGLRGAVEVLGEALRKGGVEAINALIPRVEGVAKAMALAADTGAADFTNSLEEMELQMGQTEDALAEASRGGMFAYKQAMEGLNKVTREFGKSALPLLLDTLRFWQPALQAVAKALNPTVDKTGALADDLERVEIAAKRKAIIALGDLATELANTNEGLAHSDALSAQLASELEEVSRTGKAAAHSLLGNAEATKAAANAAKDELGITVKGTAAKKRRADADKGAEKAARDAAREEERHTRQQEQIARRNIDMRRDLTQRLELQAIGLQAVKAATDEERVAAEMALAVRQIEIQAEAMLREERDKGLVQQWETAAITRAQIEAEQELTEIATRGANARAKATEAAAKAAAKEASALEQAAHRIGSVTKSAEASLDSVAAGSSAVLSINQRRLEAMDSQIEKERLQAAVAAAGSEQERARAKTALKNYEMQQIQSRILMGIEAAIDFARAGRETAEAISAGASWQVAKAVQHGLAAAAFTVSGGFAASHAIGAPSSTPGGGGGGGAAPPLPESRTARDRDTGGQGGGGGTTYVFNASPGSFVGWEQGGEQIRRATRASDGIGRGRSVGGEPEVMG